MNDSVGATPAASWHPVTGAEAAAALSPLPNVPGPQEEAQAPSRGMSESVSAPGAEAGDVAPGGGWLPSLTQDEWSGLFVKPTTTTSAPSWEGIGTSGAIAAGGGGNTGKVAAEAQRWIGTPYVWGGTDLAKGVDCSGFVQQVFKKFGVNLPRISADQLRAGKSVSMNALKPGDLVGWDNSSRNNGADHVAIYIGNGEIAEAPRPGLSVRVRKLGKNEGAFASRVLE